MSNKRCRVVTACDCCRVKKTKCNGQNPCQKCIANGSICVYSERIKKDRVFTNEEVRLIENKVEILTNSLLRMTKLIKLNNKCSINQLSKELNKDRNIPQLQINTIIKAINDIDDSDDLDTPITTPIMTTSSSSDLNIDMAFNPNSLDLIFPYNTNYSTNENKGALSEPLDLQIPKFLEEMDYFIGNDLKDDFGVSMPSQPTFSFDNRNNINDSVPQL